MFFNNKVTITKCVAIQWGVPFDRCPSTNDYKLNLKQNCTQQE